jgi:hypothetical protein
MAFQNPIRGTECCEEGCVGIKFSDAANRNLRRYGEEPNLDEIELLQVFIDMVFA